MKSVSDICADVAMDLNLPHKYVWEIYKSYWKAVRAHMSSMPLKENITEQDLADAKVSVNIPSIGKFYVDWDRLKRKKVKNERYNNNKT